MKQVFLIIDYNNTRFDDVKLIAGYARKKYLLETLLIRKDPSSIDFEIADHVIDLDHNNLQYLEIATSKIKEMKLDVLGGFVFSDRSMISGTMLLNELNVPSDSIKGSFMSLDKWQYRLAEASVRERFESVGAWLPKSKKIQSMLEAKQFLRVCKNGLILKPTCEGNNRGVMAVESTKQLKEAWNILTPYIKGGVIAEEKIPFNPEFSFDGVGSLNFVTQKFSDSGSFPVEYGQQIPSELNISQENQIRDTGLIVRDLTGTNNGAFHHEIRFDGFGITAVVEPNRRPAGMQIWDLAEKVFGFNLYHQLVDACLGIPQNIDKCIPKGVASVRMLRAPVSGLFNAENLSSETIFRKLNSQIRRSSNENVQYFSFKLQKSKNDWVDRIIRQNGDFVAQVCAYSPISKYPLQQELDAFEKIWMSFAKSLIQETKKAVA